MTTAKAQKIRKRLRDKFGFYSKNALKIRTKDGDVTPLALNDAQQILLQKIEEQYEAEGKIRVIILKARQMGLSTMVGGWLYWWLSQRKAQRGLVVTHHADSTRALFDMTRRYHENCPEPIKPQTKYSSRRELNFNILDSSYVVATAGGESVARGETVTVAHLSELAFWSPSTAEENFNAIMQAIPNKRNTAVFVESTANGVSGKFYDLWKGAIEGTNGFIPVFLPWFIQDEYEEPWVYGDDFTPEEQELIDKHSLSKEQLAFRRKKIAQNGIDLFRQEYPADADEAFLTSGRPIFNPDQLLKMIEAAEPHVARMALEADEWVKHPRGELTLYRDVEPGEQYTIGADVAMGIRGGDFSVAQILDSKKRHVGSYRAHVHPDYFADILLRLGEFFNDAYIICESNSHGLLTCTRLYKDYGYTNFHTEIVVDKISDKETVKLGFSTTAKSKPLVINELRASLRMDQLEIHDKVTLREMLTYIETETGSMEAEAGCHDDCVMALAIANYGHQQGWEPVQVLEDYYSEAI
jgi:hypothetical protein